MLNYVKRHWDETRGDKFDEWGTSWWYFEVDKDGRVTRQIEKYDSGTVLRYSAEHKEDEYGALAEVALELPEPEFASISMDEFAKLWEV